MQTYVRGESLIVRPLTSYSFEERLLIADFVARFCPKAGDGGASACAEVEGGGGAEHHDLSSQDVRVGRAF